jgi:hypothetical protein
MDAGGRLLREEAALVDAAAAKEAVTRNAHAGQKKGNHGKTAGPVVSKAGVLACIIREDTTEGVSGDMRSQKSLLSA